MRKKVLCFLMAMSLLTVQMALPVFGAETEAGDLPEYTESEEISGPDSAGEYPEEGGTETPEGNEELETAADGTEEPLPDDSLKTPEQELPEQELNQQELNEQSNSETNEEDGTLDETENTQTEAVTSEELEKDGAPQEEVNQNPETDLDETTGEGDKQTPKIAAYAAEESFSDEQLGIMPMNTLDTATVVGFNQTVYGNITESTDRNFYKITLPSSGEVSLTVDTNIECTNLYLYNSKYENIWERAGYNIGGLEWDTNTMKAHGEYSLDLIKGTYYLCVGKAGKTGSFHFQMKFVSANESYAEPNDTLSEATAITYGKKTYGQLAINDTKDFYKFTMSASGRLTLQVNTSIEWTELYIYDKNGSEVWARAGYNTGALEWDETSKKASATYNIDLNKGTYYLLFKPLGKTGNYNFEASLHMNSMKISLPYSSYVYNGKAKTPSVTVKFGNTTLKKGTDYKVYYSNNTKPGKAKIKIVGIGKYYGTVYKSFNIKPQMAVCYKPATASANSL